MIRLEHLRATPAFGDLTASELEAVGRTFRSRLFAQDDPIVVQDRTISHMGLIVKGSARAVIRGRDGQEIPCGRLNAGEFVIDISLFIGNTALAGIISAEPSICLLQHRTDFLEMLKTHPPLKDFFYRLTMLNAWESCQIMCGRDPLLKQPSKPPAPIPKNIKKSLALIDRSYSNPLTLGYLAGESGMSRYHFSRMFKHHIGCSFKTYLNHRRIEAAKNLMKHEDMNVSEACFSVGFNDLSYFSRLFKVLEGMSPSTFRKSLRP
jgi:AraC-like DNA-binding protein